MSSADTLHLHVAEWRLLETRVRAPSAATCETGGDLFGFWTHRGNPMLLVSVGPGPAAEQKTGFFRQDAGFLQRCGRDLVDRHGLQHLGQWHSHHRIAGLTPSTHDDRTMVRAVESRGLTRFLLVLASCQAGGWGWRAHLYVREGARIIRQLLPRWRFYPGPSPYALAAEDLR